MKSMTGFGNSQFSGQGVALEVGIRSVNGRYLDIRTHLPKEYMSLESKVKKILSQNLRRGTVDVFVSRRLSATARNVKVEPHKDVAKKWLQAYRDLGKALKLDTDVTMQRLSQIPEIFLVEEDFSASTKEKKSFFELLEKSLKAIEVERTREGRALKKVLETHIRNLSQIVQRMAQLRTKANVELKKKARSKIEKLVVQGQVDEQKLAFEVALQLDKSDIDEEIARLTEHIKSCRALVRGPGPQGKKLDFYCQELLREVNTVGSKSQVTMLTQAVVDAKAVVEQLREQVQNIE